MSNVIGINFAPLNSGKGKYAYDLTKLINVYSLIIDKTKINEKYPGIVKKGILPPVTSGFELNRFLLGYYLAKQTKKTDKIYHFLSPFDPHKMKRGIVTIHDLYFIRRDITGNRELYFDYIHTKFHNLDILTTTNIVKEQLIDLYKYDKEQITVIPLGVDENVFKNENLKRENIVLTVGDGKYNKQNYEICKILDEKGIYHIHIGKEVNLQHNGNKEYITNVNNETLAHYYNTSRAVIRFSSMEGFGIPAIESLMTDTPIILSNIDTFHEVLGNYPLMYDKIEDIDFNLDDIDNQFRKYHFDRNKYALTTFLANMDNYYHTFD